MAYEIVRGDFKNVARRWQWRLYRGTNDRKDVLKGVYVSCPQCGKVIAIGPHSIEDDGAVRTVLRCSQSLCQFSESNVKLVGWKDR